MRPLLLGMARGDGQRGPALLPTDGGGGSAADKLLAISGMSREEFLLTFRRKNLLPNGHWSIQKAKIRGYKARLRLKGRVIVLGKETWKALWLPRLPFFSYVHTGKADFVLVPHPSGRNIVLNDKAARARMRRILQGVE